MKALTGTVAVSGTILFIILGATTFAQVLSFSGVVNGLIGLVTGLGLSVNALVIAMLLILLFLGCFVDQVSMMLITLPFFMPLMQRYGIEPIWFGVLFLICMQLGLLTPPFGLLLFTMKGVAPPAITMRQIYMASLPYITMSMLILVLIFCFPAIATWLPDVAQPMTAIALRSPDGAKRNPGLVPRGTTAPHCAALHAGYTTEPVTLLRQHRRRLDLEPRLRLDQATDLDQRHRRESADPSPRDRPRRARRARRDIRPCRARTRSAARCAPARRPPSASTAAMFSSACFVCATKPSGNCSSSSQPTMPPTNTNSPRA